MAKNIRGVQKQNELNAAKDIRDIRSFGEKMRDSLEKGDLIIIVAAVGLATMWLAPALMELIAVALGLFLFYAANLTFSMPFRVPLASAIPDPSMLRGKSKGTPPQGKGITYMGNSISDDKELWFTDDDVRTHILIFGTTGAGKALPDDERVLTPDGWRRMGDMKEGDDIIGPDGEKQIVEAVHPQGDMDLWRLHLDDGRTMDCTGDHLWAVVPYSRPGIFGSDPDDAETEVIDTRQLSARLGSQSWPEGVSGWALPLPVPMNYGKAVGDVEDLLACARGSMLGLDKFPQQLLDAPLDVRKEAWQLILPHTQGAGARIAFEPFPEQTAKGIASLAHSLGLWAAIEPIHGSPARAQVVVDLAERRLRVRWIEKLNRTSSCRCLSISGPTGLFVAGDWVSTHNTESLLSLAYNCLVQGSGFIYVDGKGDNKLWTRVFSICRSLGREDDLLVINYMTGGRDVFGPQKTKLSNTLNPFLLGSAGGLTDMLVSLMDEAGGDNAMWQNRAISLISSIMFALVFMRDNQGLLLDVDVIREKLILENIEQLSRRGDLPVHALNSLRAYLRSLPGYKPNLQNGQQQPDIVGEQHGFLQMQFTKILGMLSESYGHIFRTNLGEVNFFDVVINRRVLVVLLPAMEKAPVELGNLGKIIIAALKQMMATGLGDRLEGSHQEIIETKPTNAPSPFMCILDEYGYYVVKGAAVMPAQARSLNFCMVFAGQDYPSFKKNNNSEEAAATVANCNIKIFMKTEDPTDTADLFEKSVGKALISRTSGYSFDTGMIGRYIDNKNASIERRERGDLLDLKDQLEGEAHILFKSTLVRAVMFYADPPNAKNVKTNSFLRVEPPTMEEMGEYKKIVTEMTKRLTHPDLMEDQISDTPAPGKLVSFLEVWRQMVEANANLATCGAAAIVAAHRQAYAALHSFSDQQREMAEEDDDFDGLDIFTDPRRMEEDEDAEDDEHEEHEEEDDEQEDNERILLNRETTRTRIAELETMAGSPSEEARERARQITEDLELLSAYPSHKPGPSDPDAVISIIQELDDDLGKSGS